MSDAPNLVLTGFMGTGKTTIGQLAAAKLNLPFIDADTVIAALAGTSIPEIFQQRGEAEFRRMESDLCRDLAARRGQVIATGGGMLVNPANLEIMQQSSVVICLWAHLDDLRARLFNDPHRPLAANWEALYEQRKPIYKDMPYHVDTSAKTAEEVTQEVIDLWRKHSASVLPTASNIPSSSGVE